MQYSENYVVVKTDNLLLSEIERNGIKLFMDPNIDDHGRRVRNYGEVISVPKRLSETYPFAMNQAGAPMYYDFDNTEVTWLSQIPITINPGDKVYYHHNVPIRAEMDRAIIKQETIGGTTWYWIKVPYEQIFCSVRNGEIVPNATWTLVEPDLESWDDILIPVPELNEDGTPKVIVAKKMVEGIMRTVYERVMKPRDQWIQTKVAPDVLFLRGFVRHAGEPLIGHEKDLFPGDYIIYKRNADFVVEIEGKKYLLIRQHHIEAKVV